VIRHRRETLIQMHRRTDLLTFPSHTPSIASRAVHARASFPLSVRVKRVVFGFYLHTLQYIPNALPSGDRIDESDAMIVGLYRIIEPSKAKCSISVRASPTCRDPKSGRQQERRFNYQAPQSHRPHFVRLINLASTCLHPVARQPFARQPDA
jgi:hypothetical protein